MATNTKREIVIIGGGIIGSCSAYYLTRHPSYDPALHKITLLEASEIAGGASGKAGGLLALWAYPSSIVPLSFKLHAQLAKEHNGKDRWGYREVNCGQLIAKGHAAQDKKEGTGPSVSLQKRDPAAIGKLRAAGIPPDLDWLNADSLRGYESMSGPGETAQVHPYLFTTSITKLAEEKGVNIVLGKATGIDQESDGVKSISYTDKASGESRTIPATDVIVSAGPWTQAVYPPAPISATRAHSVVIRPTRPVSAYTLFTNIELPSPSNPKRSTVTTPEIYARPDDTVYACGDGDHLVPLPETTADVEVDELLCQDIINSVGSISDELKFGDVAKRQACYLPNVAAGGGPLIGHTGIKGLYLASGHTCWGIQNAPGTGKLISEFVFEGSAKSAKIAALDPQRYM
ncbi:FAD dependent oxidoreductase [Talaromyces proteolyticus]|uniref:FAD dependent oxidoreductase n=1 Tax=Talaromyces proteolyticus TaxID=1131652 RepID=A0AAD4PUH8_9EURO|nr:FAD dependent oxidoreductase [Talaromyces proteolyticus]KAH8695111.1 FAD dependent oxidoreductase [Talaromyces proteolyticus]